MILKHVRFSLVTQSCPTLCDPMNCSMPGLSVHHQLLEFTQTHIHWVGDAIQPSHPLSSPSPAFNLSQHQGLSQWVSSLHQEAKVNRNLLLTLFIYLTAPSLSCSMWALSCGMWELVPWPGIEPGPPTLGV